MMVKTPAFPDGVYLMSTGRPVLDREGTVRAASSACAPRSQRSRNP
jgi:hypothetical protein